MSKIKNYLGRNLKSKRTKDKLSKKKRSLLMSQVRSEKTILEINFFKLLKKRGLTFKAHPKDIFGHPDLILRKKNICLFVDSDFWHGWQYPRWKHKLKNQFWRDKIENNRKRDKKITGHLRKNKWKVLRFWEHNIKKDPEKVIKKVQEVLARYGK